MADPTPVPGAATPASTGGAAAPVALTIPEEAQKRYPQLIELIKASESMNNEERQYWINILPIMTEEQVKNLYEILDNERKQLAAIDAKYQNEMQKLGTAESVAQLEEERKKRREDRQKTEASASVKETEATEDILKQIEDAGKAA